jgi:hypothetical protein
MWGTLLDRTMSIQRAVLTQDAGGGTVRTYGPLSPALSVPCSLQSARAATVEWFLRRNIDVDYEIYTTSDLDVLMSGGVKLTDAFVDGNGILYAVKGVKRDQNLIISPEPIYCIACQRVVS